MYDRECKCRTDEHCPVHDINVCFNCGLHHSQPKCPDCGCCNPDSPSYCRGCGARQDTPFCAECGIEEAMMDAYKDQDEPDAKPVCRKCGGKDPWKCTSGWVCESCLECKGCGTLHSGPCTC